MDVEIKKYLVAEIIFYNRFTLFFLYCEWINNTAKIYYKLIKNKNYGQKKGVGLINYYAVENDR